MNTAAGALARSMGKGLVLPVLLLALAIPVFSTKIIETDQPCPVCSQTNKYSQWMSGGNYFNPYWSEPFSTIRFPYLYSCRNCHFTTHVYFFQRLVEAAARDEKKFAMPLAGIVRLLKELDARFGQRAGAALSGSYPYEYLIAIHRWLHKEFNFVFNETGPTSAIAEEAFYYLAIRCTEERKKERAREAADRVLADLAIKLENAREDNLLDETLRRISNLHNQAIMQICADRNAKALAIFHRLLRDLDHLQLNEGYGFDQDSYRTYRRFIQNMVMADVQGVLSAREPFAQNRSISSSLRLKGIYLLVLSVLGLGEPAILLYVIFWGLLAAVLFLVLCWSVNKIKTTAARHSILAIWVGSMFIMLITLLFERAITVPWGDVIPALYIAAWTWLALLVLVLLLRIQRFFWATGARFLNFLDPIYSWLALFACATLIAFLVFTYFYNIQTSTVIIPILFLELFWLVMIALAEKSSGRLSLFGRKLTGWFVPFHFLGRGLIILPLAVALGMAFSHLWGSTISFLFIAVLWLGLELAAENVASRFAFSENGRLFSTQAWYFLRLGIIFSPLVFMLTQWPQDACSWLWTLQQHYRDSASPWMHIAVWPDWPWPNLTPALYLVASLAGLLLIFFLLTVLYKRVTLFRNPLAMMVVVWIAAYGLGHFATEGFPPLFYLAAAIAWFFFILLLEYGVIRRAFWDRGDISWSRQLIGRRSWKYLRVWISLMPLLVGPITAPGGDLFLQELVITLF